MASIQQYTNEFILKSRWGYAYVRAQENPERFYMDPRAYEEEEVRKFFTDVKHLDKKTWEGIKHLRHLMIGNYRNC